MMKKIIYSLVLSFILAACSRGVAIKAKYDALQYGMSYEEAVKVIGGAGNLANQKRLTPGVPRAGEKEEDVSYLKTYEWKNPNGTTITAVFLNNKLSQKGQSGL